MTIQDLIDQFEIQGAYRIKEWSYREDDYIILAKGSDFECEYWTIANSVKERKITYMYAVNGVLNIEVE